MNNNETKQQAMSAIAAVQSVAQVGMAKVTLGASVYAAHMRQVDLQAAAQRPQRPLRMRRRDVIGRKV